MEWAMMQHDAVKGENNEFMASYKRDLLIHGSERLEERNGDGDLWGEIEIWVMMRL